MIVERILQGLMQVAQAFVQWVDGALPDVDIPDVGGFVYGYSILDGIFPLHEFIDLIKTSLLVVVTIASVYAVMWLIRRIKELPFL